MMHREDDEQAALFAWIDLHKDRPGCGALRLIFHVPNGGARSAMTGARLKRLGVRRGVPDVWLPVARQDYNGLVGEMKAPGGKLTSEQWDWKLMLSGAGWRFETWHSWADAARDIANYLEIEGMVSI